MKIERAIEILDPEHREHYEDLEEVNEACRMGMEALKRIHSGKLVEPVRCRDCRTPHNRFTGCPRLNGLVTPGDFFCPYGERKQ